MNIKLKEKATVTQETENHYKIIINDKEVWVSKHFKHDEFGIENDTEIFKGEELLTEEEQDEVIEFVDNEADNIDEDIDVNNAQHPVRQKAIRILESIAEYMDDEKMFDCKDGNSTWFDLEDLVTKIVAE